MHCQGSLPFCMLSPIWYVLRPPLLCLSESPLIPPKVSLNPSKINPSLLHQACTLVTCLITCVSCLAFSYLWGWPLSQTLRSFRAGDHLLFIFTPTQHNNRHLINAYWMNEIILLLCTFRVQKAFYCQYLHPLSISSQTSNCNQNPEITVNL